MKRIIVFMLAALLLAGCNSGQEKDGEATTEVTNNRIIKLYDEQLSLENISKENIVETAQNKNICIEYPAIDGNSAKFDSVNALIKKCAEEANSFYYDESLTDINITCTYEIPYYTGKHITILFNTLFSARDIAHPTSYSYGVSIDIENARVLDFGDMGLTLAGVEARIEDNDYSIEYGGMKLMSYVEVRDTVKEALGSHADKNYGGVFYRDADSVYMIVSPISHSLGDYSIIKFTDEIQAIKENRE